MGMGTLPSNIMNNTPHEMVMAIIGNQLFHLVITSQLPHSLSRRLLNIIHC